MSSKNRTRYRTSYEALLGGLIKRLASPESKPFDEMDEDEKQREIEWLDYIERDGPGWDKYLRGEKCAWEIPRTPEQRAADWARKPLLARAICFAADKHAGQMRKDKRETAYIEHLFAVAAVLVEVGEVSDKEVLAAAFLHDTLEDTATTPEELANNFGRRVRALVEEITDDKSLPKEERKRLQIEHARKLSEDATLIKLADKSANVRDVIFSPPRDWDLSRREKYLSWAEAVLANCPEVNEALESHFAQTVNTGRELLQNPASLKDAGRTARREISGSALSLILSATRK